MKEAPETKTKVSHEEDAEVAKSQNEAHLEAGDPSVNDSQAQEPVVEKSPEEEIKEWKTKAAYLAAEMENMGKRFQREKAELIRFANEGVLQKVLPVVDNLDLALKAGKASGNENAASEKLLEQMLQGVDMTLKHFEDTLKMLGIEFIETKGQEFDPTLHEAVGQCSNQEQKDNIISEEFQRGFRLNGRVIRAAKVIVNKI